MNAETTRALTWQMTQAVAAAITAQEQIDQAESLRAAAAERLRAAQQLRDGLTELLSQ